MPVTDARARLSGHLLPVSSPCAVGDTMAEIDNSDDVVSREAVVIHQQNLHGYVTDIHAGDVKLKRLVEYRREGVAFDARLPFLIAFSLV